MASDGSCGVLSISFLTKEPKNVAVEGIHVIESLRTQIS
jgi:hypothetical protein